MTQRSLLSVGCLLAAVALATPMTGLSSTILHTVADSSYTDLAAQSQYASSGYISVNQGGGSFVIGSGTLVAPNWVLTAAHVVSGFSAGQISFGQGAQRPASLVGPYSVAQVVVYPTWTGDLSAGNDLALIRLSSNVTGVTPAPLYNASVLGTEVGKTATVVGYQGQTGTGLTGNTTSTYARRAMTNVIDLIGAPNLSSLGKDAAGNNINYGFGSPSSNIMFTDFDSPDNNATPNSDPSNFYNLMGSGDPTALEGSQVPGDSGGGLFLTVSGTTYIAGVTSFVGSFGNTPFAHGSNNGFYGDENGFTRVSPFINFINTTVPEPTAIMLVAVAACSLIRRHRAR